MMRGFNPAGGLLLAAIRVGGAVAGVLLPLSGVLFAAPVAANHQAACAERGEIQQALDRDYGESRVATGVTNTGMLLEVFATDTGSTWTILLTSPEGTSCIVAQGEGWRQLMEWGVGV